MLFSLQYLPLFVPFIVLPESVLCYGESLFVCLFFLPIHLSICTLHCITRIIVFCHRESFFFFVCVFFLQIHSSICTLHCGTRIIVFCYREIFSLIHSSIYFLYCSTRIIVFRYKARFSFSNVFVYLYPLLYYQNNCILF